VSRCCRRTATWRSSGAPGKLANLEERLGEVALPGTLAIGHTRWATHGPPTDRNAHPHVDGKGEVAVVHNGTIENFEELLHGLRERGHERRSDTDTEVVAHLLEERYADGPTKGDLPACLRSICKDLEGSFVLVVSHRDEPGLVVAARRNLPLVIGLGDGENFVGSDVTAFIAHTREARAVEQDQVVEVRRTGVVVTDLEGTVVEGESYHVDWDTDAAEKDGYEFFMLKEIEEQPGAVRDTLGGRLTAEGLMHLDELAMSDEDVRGIEQVFIVACGSAYHSGWSASTPSSAGAACPCRSRWPGEFRYRDPCSAATPSVIAVSQSRRDRRHARGRAARRAQRAWVSPSRTPSARPSAARATPRSTPAAGRRSPSPRPRP
jgi:glucosamine--fructose-6-phosphate aminotransferase (isomerizing)